MEELITQVRDIIHRITESVYYYRMQNHTKGHMQSGGVIRLGEKYFETAAKVGFNDSIELLLPIWKTLLEASESGDEIWLADIYEFQLLDAFYDIQNCLVEAAGGEPHVYWDANMALMKDKDEELYKVLKNAKENNDRDYILGWARTGDTTLSVGNKNYGVVKLCSSVNPWQEAMTYANAYIDSAYEQYMVLGLGMGYHIDAMAMNDGCKKVIVLENDLEQFRIAMMYRDMKRILSSRKVTLVYCKEPRDYAKWLGMESEAMLCHVWYPSMKTILNDSLRELIENYWVSYNSMRNMSRMMADNFDANVKNGDNEVDCLRSKFEGKDMILLAAGPSLDDNIEELKNIADRDNVCIVCVGKVARKIIGQGIKPDYIVMIDAKATTRWQISGIEDCGVPLIYLPTVAANVVKEYHAQRYVAYQEDYDKSEKYASDNGLSLYQTGGSVATFAIDLGIRMGCASIVCVGLDMGYRGDRTHANGIGSKITNMGALREVEGVHSDKIYTSKTLDMFRRWIEHRIQGVKDTKLINASDGARIHGMVEMSLTESMNSN